jgi:hypothetical protein
VVKFDLSETLTQVIDECAKGGMASPFIVCAASPNGSVLAMRMINGGPPNILTKHDANGGLKIPMSVMVLDQKNKAVRIIIDEDGMTRH